MAVMITVPELGTSSGRVSLWYVQTGEWVCEGDRVVELIIPGAVVEVSAPTSGMILERHLYPGDRITPGMTLGLITPDER
jgi:pyruvate/2-oxoglutarate dehydrogenase complex dihydrolipoamide acyltransferase (E2) component